jgi:hypothetical protein
MKRNLEILVNLCYIRGTGSVVGIATSYWLDSLGIESRWGARFSAPVQTGPGANQPPVQWVPGLSWGERAARVCADPSPPSRAVVLKGKSYTSTPPMGCTACTEPQCLYKGALSTYSGLEDACWPLVPKFAGSNPAKAVGIFRAKKSLAGLPLEGK